MIYLFILLLAIICLLILIRIKNKNNEEENKNELNAYFSKKNVLTVIEQKAYWRIVEAAGNERVVLAQVSFASFLKTNGEKRDSRILFNTARQKIADFAICNKNFEIIKIIEIDDKSHSEEKDLKRDQITKSADIATLRYDAKNLPSIEELRKDLE